MRTDVLGRLGRTLIIVNPAAQMGAAGTIADRLQRFLTMYLHGDDTFGVVRTERPRHAVEIARGAGTFDTVIAVGGDGVVHEVACGLMRIDERHRPALAVLPVGSGNDYARTLGLRDWHGEHFDALLCCERAKLDVGRIEYRAGDGPMRIDHFVQTCSFGLDAAIALGTYEMRERTGLVGTPLYALCGVDVFGRRYRSHPALMALDGAPRHAVDALIFAVQIGRTYGSGFDICPQADPADGLFDVCYACAPCPRAAALALFAAAKRGRHVGSPRIHLERARRVDLAFSDADVPIQADGERIRATELSLEIEPGALTVLRPIVPERS